MMTLYCKNKFKEACESIQVIYFKTWTITSSRTLIFHFDKVILTIKRLPFFYIDINNLQCSNGLGPDFLLKYHCPEYHLNYAAVSKTMSTLSGKRKKYWTHNSIYHVLCILLQKINVFYSFWFRYTWIKRIGVNRLNWSILSFQHSLRM